MKRKDAKEHSTAYKVGGLGLETLWRVSKNFSTELSVKYSTVHVIESHSTTILQQFYYSIPICIHGIA